MTCVKTFALSLATRQVLVQEFLVGTEYVVDTVSRDGNHKVFARDPEWQPFFGKYSRSMYMISPLFRCRHTSGLGVALISKVVRPRHR